MAEVQKVMVNLVRQNITTGTHKDESIRAIFEPESGEVYLNADELTGLLLKMQAGPQAAYVVAHVQGGVYHTLVDTALNKTVPGRRNG